jgi:hypothetical protein
MYIDYKKRLRHCSTSEAVERFILHDIFLPSTALLCCIFVKIYLIGHIPRNILYRIESSYRDVAFGKVIPQKVGGDIPYKMGDIYPLKSGGYVEVK